MQLRARTPEEVPNVVAELERVAKTKADYIADSRNISFARVDDRPVAAVVDMGNGVGMVPFGVTDIAHEQFAAKTSIPIAYYRRMLAESPDLLAANVNEWLHREQNKRRLVRTLDGEVRAYLSSRFRIMDNHDLFFHGAQTGIALGAKVIDADLSDSRFYCRMIKPDWETTIDYGDQAHGGTRPRDGGDTVVPGVVFSNSEVGRGGLQIEYFIWRGMCRNGCVFSTELRRIHLGRDKTVEGLLSDRTKDLSDKVLWSEVSDFISATFDRAVFDEQIAKINHAAQSQLPAPTEAVDVVVKSFSDVLTDDDKQAILDELISPSTDVDPGRTVWGLVNAVTTLANRTDNADRAAALHRVGGEIIEATEELVAVRRKRAGDGR